mmetsp:Transcript_23107/g.48063  ORF Transcript_23107/g.48063 Transcript_23107/m.48063 type:complete len:88 (+) Transcript_23107:16-279(+)
MGEKKRQQPKSASQGSEDRYVLQLGRIRVNLGRVPELLLLIAFAWYVTQACTEYLDVTLPAAVPMGLFAARQVQRLLAFLSSAGKEE